VGKEKREFGTLRKKSPFGRATESTCAGLGGGGGKENPLRQGGKLKKEHGKMMNKKTARWVKKKSPSYHDEK